MRYIEFTWQGWRYRALCDGAEVLKCEAMQNLEWVRTHSANVHRAAHEAVAKQREQERANQ